MNGKTNSKTKKLILFALLAGGILSGGIGYWLLKGIGQKNEATFLSLKRARLAVLDQQAAVHFKNAREHVKNAVNTLTTPGNLLKICGKFCYDKFKGTNELQSFLSSHISPVTEECKKAAAIYGVDFESTQFASAMQEAAKGTSISPSFLWEVWDWRRSCSAILKFIQYYWLPKILFNLFCAEACPCFAAFVYHFTASSRFFSTP